MVRPFLSDKTVNSPKITLVEKNEIIYNEEKILFLTSKFFIIKTMILREELMQLLEMIQ